MGNSARRWMAAASGEQGVLRSSTCSASLGTAHSPLWARVSTTAMQSRAITGRNAGVGVRLGNLMSNCSFDGYFLRVPLSPGDDMEDVLPPWQVGEA